MLTAGLYAVAALAQEVPPPAPALPPSAQASPRPCSTPWPCGKRHPGNGRLVPWPWSLNVAGQSRRFATRRRLRWPAGRCAPRHTRMMRAWARSTSVTTSTALPARATCWIRIATCRCRRDPGRSSTPPARTGCWRSALPRRRRPPPAIGAACRATLPAMQDARDQPPRSSRRQRDQSPTKPHPAHLAFTGCTMLLSGLPLASRAGEPLIVVEDRGGTSALPYYEALNLQPRQRTGAAVHPDAQLPATPADEAAMLPVRSAKLTPGTVARRVIETPACGRSWSSATTRASPGLVAAPRRRFARTWRGRPGGQRRDRAGLRGCALAPGLPLAPRCQRRPGRSPGPAAIPGADHGHWHRAMKPCRETAGRGFCYAQRWSYTPSRRVQAPRFCAWWFMVARAEPSMGVGSILAFRCLRRDPLPRCPRHSALPAQHPPPAAVRDDEQGRAGQPAALVRGARVSLGAEAHPWADADVPAGVSPLHMSSRRRPTGWPGAWRNGWVRAVPAVPARAHGLGRAFQPDARLPCRRPAAPAWHQADEVDVSPAAGGRVGHSLVLGTTRVGERGWPSYSSWDIRRNAAGETRRS